MPPPGETCLTCKFWDKIQNNPQGNVGYCRRYPPPRVERPERVMGEHCAYPTTHEEEYCGDYVKAN